jgi:hypothetical protein
MLKIKWTYKITNDEIFQIAKEEKITSKDRKNRRHSWRWNIITHNEFVVNLTEGTISGKKAAGRPRLQYLKQVTRYTEAGSYTAVIEMACNNSRWKAAYQPKD